MPLVTEPYDTAEHLKTSEDVAFYLDAVLEDGDPALIREAIGNVARARGMTRVARDTGLGRESLYKALSETGNPSFETVHTVLKAFGLTLTVRPTESSVS